MINYLQPKVRLELHRDRRSPKQWCQCVLDDNFMLGGVTLVVIREFIKVHNISSAFAIVMVNFFSICYALMKLTITIAKSFFSVTSVLLTHC